MGVLEYTNGVFNLKIEADEPIILDDPSVYNFESALRVLAAGASIDSFDLKKTGPKYEYKFTSNGRHWFQSLWVPIDGSEASMDFNVTGQWLESEFALHRPVRQAVVEMIRKFKVTEIEGEWL